MDEDEPPQSPRDDEGDSDLDFDEALLKLSSDEDEDDRTEGKETFTIGTIDVVPGLQDSKDPESILRSLLDTNPGHKLRMAAYDSGAPVGHALLDLSSMQDAIDFCGSFGNYKGDKPVFCINIHNPRCPFTPTPTRLLSPSASGSRG